ncbi:MAG: hypothetical protein WDO06_01945 [Actinomycetota bacterium]
MEIYDGSGETFVEIEKDQEFLDLMTEFYFSNRSRYKEQAKKLLREGRLLLPIGDSLLKYIVKDGWTGYKVSEDEGLNFSDFLSLGPLPWWRRAKIEKLIEQFAHSEASQTLDL